MVRGVIDSGTVVAWEPLGEHVKLEGFRRVVSRRYRLPTGKEADWDILVGGATVAIVALTEDDRQVLVRQFRPGPAKVLLELPGGNVDRGESVEAAAKRELLEETGFAAAALEVVVQTWLAAYSTAERYAVVARGCRRVAEPELEQGEFLEPVEVCHT